MVKKLIGTRHYSDHAAPHSASSEISTRSVSWKHHAQLDGDVYVQRLYQVGCEVCFNMYESLAQAKGLVSKKIKRV